MVTDLVVAPAFQFVFDEAKMIPAPSEMKQFVRDLEGDDFVRMKQKRTSPRIQIAIDVPAVALDEHFLPVGGPFIAVSRNLSAGGVCLVHTCRIDAPHLLIKLASQSGSSVQVIVQVIRCRQLKRYFEVAGKFIARGDGALV